MIMLLPLALTGMVRVSSLGTHWLDNFNKAQSFISLKVHFQGLIPNHGKLRRASAQRNCSPRTYPSPTAHHPSASPFPLQSPAPTLSLLSVTVPTCMAPPAALPLLVEAASLTHRRLLGPGTSGSNGHTGPLGPTWCLLLARCCPPSQAGPTAHEAAFPPQLPLVLVEEILKRSLKMTQLQYILTAGSWYKAGSSVHKSCPNCAPMLASSRAEVTSNCGQLVLY